MASTSTWRQRVYLALDNHPRDPLSRAIGLGLQALILLNVVAVMVESVASASSMTSPDTRSFLMFIDICTFILE